MPVDVWKALLLPFNLCRVLLVCSAKLTLLTNRQTVRTLVPLKEDLVDFFFANRTSFFGIRFQSKSGIVYVVNVLLSGTDI